MTRPDSRYVVLAARSLLKEVLWYFTCDHEQGPANNILLFATRRGGSTFLMELISANQGIRSIDQPFEMSASFPTAAQVADLPLFADGQLTSLDDRSERRLRSLTERIFDGKVVINAPTRTWRSDVEFHSNRLVLKITDAKPLIGWFAENFACDVVYLTRHPIPQAMSCVRNNWSLTTSAYLNDQRFVEANVPNDALALAQDVMATGTPLQQFVVNWVLENAAPMRLLPEHPSWLHVRYEDCITDPVGTLDTVATRLGLTDLESMQSVLNRPSVSSVLSTGATRQLIASGRAADAVTGWRRDVDVELLSWCDRLLESFEIDPATILPPS